jgi:hypothetical protein
MNKSIKAIAYHRNGCTGLGFHVAIVKNGRDDMLVVRFPAESDNAAGGVLCAAFNINYLANRDIAVGSNSYRGDEFAGLVDAEIARRDAAYSVEEVESIEVEPLREAA